MAAPRFLVAVGLGIVTTFALFWIMQALIGVDAELEEGGAPPSVDFVRLKRDQAPETKEREPPERQKPQQQPPPPEMDMSQNMDASEATGEVVPMGDPGAEIEQATALGAGTADRGVVPLVRVDPEYPPRAKQRGVEGYVDLEFTITPSGTVDNAHVIGARPPGVFEQAALRAVRRWRYNPKIEEGEPVSRPGIQVRLRFELDKGR